MIGVDVLYFWSILLFLNIAQPAGTIASTNLQENISDTRAGIPTPEQDQQLKILILALIPIVVAFAFVVFLFYRQRREAYFKQTEAELKLTMAQVEIKALRAQMNPHFIFNCLNSIHHYMHRNNIREAGNYLVKFSQLIRHILETSSSRMIPLSDEVHALKLYLSLEQLRMDHTFDFEITMDETISSDDVSVPPMLIQPFVENSVWHGMNTKGRRGRISIHMVRHDGRLKCTIEDNGVENKTNGQPQAAIGVKKTSMGMALVREQLAIASKLYDVKADFDIKDIVDTGNHKIGKRVELFLPYEE